MRLFSLNDAPPLGPGLRVRESPFWSIMGGVFVFGGSGALVWALLAGHLPPIFWFSAVFMVLFGALVLRSITATFSLDNWRLHVGEPGITIKFRTPLNRHLPREDKVIAFVPWNEMEAAFELRRTVTMHHQRREQLRSHAYIVFRFRQDARELAEAIEAERNKSTPPGCISGGRFLHDLALMEDPRHLRIELISPHSHATPSRRKILEAIERHIPIIDTAREEAEGRMGR